MAKRALSWKRAAAIGWRDLKSAPGKFGFVVLSVAVGVAALVGVRGLSDSFRQSLGTEARSLLAGDLSARTFRAPTPEELSKIASIEAQSGGTIRSTWVTETISMVSVPSDPVPLLVSLKAVDPAEYPYYGTADLEPAMPLQQALQGDSAVVADEFLIRLNARVGQTLRLGGRTFTITAALKQEPDRISGGIGIGPRVMISQAALARTGLLAPGSRAGWRLLVKLPGNRAAARAHRRCRDGHGASATRGGTARCASDGLSRRQSRAHPRPRQRNLNLEPHLPGRYGAGRYRRGHGHARAPRAAHGHAGDFEGRWRGFLRSAAHLSLADARARIGRSAVGRGRGSGCHGGAAGGIWQSPHLSSCISISLAVGAGRHGNRPSHNTAFLFASAARCARG